VIVIHLDDLLSRLGSSNALSIAAIASMPSLKPQVVPLTPVAFQISN